MEIDLLCSPGLEGSLSDISEYQKVMDEMVSGEDDEWLHCISKPPLEKKKSIIFSWLTSQTIKSEKTEGTKPVEVASLDTSESLDTISIGSLIDLEAMTDLKLFGVTSEEAKNYGPADLGFYDGFTIEELLQPLEFESEALEIPTGIQNCLEGYLKKIKNNAGSGTSSLTKFTPPKDSHPLKRSSVESSSKRVTGTLNQMISNLTQNSSPSPGSVLNQKYPVQRNRSLLSKSIIVGTKTESSLKSPQKEKITPLFC
ncbi:hypothetical protein DSO57_1022942 [Entomophthora muscae]|uniref:Uncharacterized protein n=1 Tax=Entomophthora muscae TaxID=34485 RepID=A0ACC2UNY2_9FUNG|nr:hypothetical protein DSO57_1022942 [Entomophthora muscae]